jgi:excisionase family DNA binding protein
MVANKDRHVRRIPRQPADAREPAQHNETPLPLLLTVEQAARRLNIGRSTVYELLQSGRLKSVTVGRLRRVPTSALTEFIDSLPDEL